VTPPARSGSGSSRLCRRSFFRRRLSGRRLGLSRRSLTLGGGSGGLTLSSRLGLLSFLGGLLLLARLNLGVFPGESKELLQLIVLVGNIEGLIVLNKSWQWSGQF